MLEWVRAHMDILFHYDSLALFTGFTAEMASFPVSTMLHKSSCFPQTTEWTECSTTCGMGISSRVSNDHPDCRLLRETRLCQIRQCELQPPAASKVRYETHLQGKH